MFWVVLLVIVGIIAAFVDTIVGKIVIGAVVVALDLLLLSWITGLAFLITLAKVCAIIIVITITGALLLAIIG